jgi:hypothetical protein
MRPGLLVIPFGFGFGFGFGFLARGMAGIC